MAVRNQVDDPTQDFYGGGGSPAQTQAPTPDIPPGYIVDPTTGQLVPDPNAAGRQLIARNDPANNAAAVAAAADGLPTTGHGGSTPPPMPAAPDPGPPSSGGGGGGAPAPSGGGVTDPALYAPFTQAPPAYVQPTFPTAPTYPTIPNAPTYTPPPAFSYADFQAPTLEQAQSQPGYQFGLQQGEQALQQSRAAQGVLRTGGTLKDILDYGRNAATQNYNNVYNQDANTYNTNRAGAVQQYNTNYQTQYQDPYAAAVQGFNTNVANQYVNPFNAAQQNYTTQYNNALPTASAQNNYNADAYKTAADIFYANENNPFAKYTTLQDIALRAS